MNHFRTASGDRVSWQHLDCRSLQIYSHYSVLKWSVDCVRPGLPNGVFNVRAPTISCLRVFECRWPSTGFFYAFDAGAVCDGSKLSITPAATRSHLQLSLLSSVIDLLITIKQSWGLTQTRSWLWRRASDLRSQGSTTIKRPLLADSQCDCKRHLDELVSLQLTPFWHVT